MKLLLILSACAGILFMTSCAVTTSSGGSSDLSSYNNTALLDAQAEADATQQDAANEAAQASQTMSQQQNDAANQESANAAASAVPPAQ